MPWKEWWFFVIIITVSLIIGTIAGLYPSLFLSRIESINTLKGKLNKSKKMSGIFSNLVIIQFAASIILVICSIMVYRQMDFIMDKKVGFEKEQVLVLKNTNTLGTNITALKNELLTIPNIKSVTASSYLPIEKTKRNSDSFWDGLKGRDASVVSQIWTVDCDYINTLGMNIVEGREFNNNPTMDNREAIINQTMAKELDLKSPLGEQILNNEGHRWEIVGVVEDFNFESFKTSINPLFMVLGNSNEIMAIKIGTFDIQATIGSIEQKWDEFLPNQSIRYSFLDQEFATMYSDIKRMGSIILNFTFLAIFIACLGLFALVQFTIKNRIKEIGIRKVNGAKKIEVLVMLNKDFIKWVVIAFIISIPIAWYAMHKWLESFAYKTSFSWWIIILTGLLAIGIALLTVTWQSWQAATRNPVEALR